MRTRSFVVVPAVLLAFVVSCREGGSVAPLATGIIPLLGTAGDTIETQPIQALVVQVRDEHSIPLAGKIVRFESVGGFFGSKPTVFVSALTSTFFGTLAAAESDAEGKAAVLLQLGPIAGDAKVTVTVPELGLRDTLGIVIKPGNAVKVRFNVRDTALFIGKSFELDAKLADRNNNLRPEAAVVTNATPAVCSLANGRVSALKLGQCMLTSSNLTTADTARISAVPELRLAVVALYSALSLISSDGSALKTVLPTNHASLSPGWSRDATRLAIYEGDPFSTAVISVLDTTGVRVAQIGQNSAMFSAYFGRFSPDGKWLYFSGRATADDPIALWRWRMDNSSPEMLFPATSGFESPHRASISPDGNTLAFETQGKIALLDIATRDLTPLDLTGLTPSFSPNGQLLAFYGGGGSNVSVANRDGSGLRGLTGNNQFGVWQAPEWTPDGKWLLVKSSFGALMFVSVDDGSTVPVSRLSNYEQVAIRP